MGTYTTDALNDGGWAAGSGPGYSLSPSGTRVTQSMAELMDRGYTPQQAAGIVGNWMAESGPNLNPQAVQGQDQSRYQPAGTAQDVMGGLAASRHGYGLSQTTDPSRKAYMASALQGYAPFGGFTAALNASADEIGDNYPGFAEATNLAGSTQYGFHTYENPEDQSASKLAERMGFARTALGLAPADQSSATGFYTPGVQDFGTQNPVDAYGNVSYGTAPVSPVERSNLPDISQAPMGATYGDLGYRDSIEPGMPTIASDQPGAARTADVGPYGFSGLQPSAAQNALGMNLSSQYSTMGVQPDQTPSYGTISSDQPAAPAPAPTVKDYGFSRMQTAPMAPATNLQTALEPSYTSTYDGSVPPSPTADPYGTPPQQAAVEAPQQPVEAKRMPSFIDNPYNAATMPTAASYAPAALATATSRPAIAQALSQGPATNMANGFDFGTPQIGGWGVANGLTGIAANDATVDASNARMQNVASFVDPLTRQTVETDPNSTQGGWGMNLGGGGWSDNSVNDHLGGGW